VARPETYLHLWDVGALDPEGSALELEPVHDFAPGAHLGRTAFFSDGNLAFSPDNTLLAVLLPDEILLLTVPDLEIYDTQPIDVPDLPLFNTLVWSLDGMLLTAGYSHDYAESTVLVWDLSADQLYDYRGETWGHTITLFADGWTFGLHDSFAVCTARLENCDIQPIEGQVLAVDPFRRQIITGNDRNGTTTIAWTRGADGVWTADEAAYDYLGISCVPTGFSPGGRYVVGMCWPTSGNPPYPHWMVWDAEQQFLPFDTSASDIRPPVWLGDTGYFVNGGGGELRHPLNGWLDLLPDLYEIEGLAEDSLEATIEKFAPYHEVWGVRGASDNGRRFLLVVGGTALVIPVIYK
jgi:hypothetical protein